MHLLEMLGGSLAQTSLPALAVFSAVSVFHLVCCRTEKWKLGRGISKALLMPLLLVFYLLSCRQPDGWIIVGICLGFLGDVFLLVPQKKWAFLAGLVSFLLGHICYIVAFALRIGWEVNKALCPPLWFLLLVGVVLAAIGSIAFLSLYKGLGDMLIPAGAYLLVILTMAFFTFSYAYFISATMLFRSSIPPFQGLWLLAPAGGLLFVASDYMLARFNFVKPAKRGGFWVMLTYILAQLLIVLSLLPG